jgi:hypothetical protein
MSTVKKLVKKNTKRPKARLAQGFFFPLMLPQHVGAQYQQRHESLAPLGPKRSPNAIAAAA